MLDYFLKCPPFILTLVRATLCEFISQENDFKIAWRISQGIWPAVLLAQLRKPPRALLFVRLKTKHTKHKVTVHV